MVDAKRLGCTKPFGKLQPIWGLIGHKYFRAASDAEGLKGEKSDHPGPHDKSGFAENGAQPSHCMQCYRQGLCEGGLLKRKTFREFDEDMLRNEYILRKGTVPTEFFARHSKNLPIFAQVDFPLGTEATLSTPDGRIEGDGLTDLPSGNPFAELSYLAGSFVSHDKRWKPSACTAV
jgi:hypothetical protein